MGPKFGPAGKGENPLKSEALHRDMPKESRSLYCETMIEDEYHFIMVCPLYSDLSFKYLQSFYYMEPTFYKFYHLMALQDETSVRNLAMCIYYAFKERNTFLSNFS